MTTTLVRQRRHIRRAGFKRQLREGKRRRPRSLELDLARAITQRREELRLSKAELARRLGCAPQYLVEVERGESNFTIGTIRKLAEALELTERELLRDVVR